MPKEMFTFNSTNWPGEKSKQKKKKKLSHLLVKMFLNDRKATGKNQKNRDPHLTFPDRLSCPHLFMLSFRIS